MLIVRFVETAYPNQIIDDVEMDHAPSIGETIRFRFPDRHEETYVVASVEHVIDIKLGLGNSTDRERFVQCGLSKV
ncbi:hypothetical protein [Novosphingobium sp. LASN5T]|uniref:hypothetical protein n=1 Tax=Novosphingobium sp. LASN5T TaxID=2491021 RepID=UPI000F5EA67B|nr:hypothetical protein [Novosphingobium sp. LASN5T]